MIYVKSVLIGIGALIVSVSLFTLVFDLLHLDARYFMGAYPLVSLPIMAAVFAIGFLWQLAKSRKRRLG